MTTINHYEGDMPNNIVYVWDAMLPVTSSIIRQENEYGCHIFYNTAEWQLANLDACTVAIFRIKYKTIV